MGKAGILPVGYPPSLCTEAKEQRPAARSLPPCVSHLIVGMFAHLWQTALSAKNAGEESILSSANHAQKVAKHTAHIPKKVDKITNHWYACTNKNTKATNGTNTFCWPTENCGLVQRGSKQKGYPPASLREKRPRSPPLPGSREAASTPSSLAL